MKLAAQYINSQLAPYHTANNIFIGYSGGVDSHVLLHLLANIPELKHKLCAVYVHHGLQAAADNWAIHCQQVAEDFGVHFEQIKVNAQALPGQSPEEAARNARYQAFKKLLSKNDLLIFAQHRDDQLETVLLQLFRGAGLKGLSGMPNATNFSEGILIRPLLAFDQKTIKDYALQHKLHWIDDASNLDTQFDRNYLRHKVIPLLERRWPSLDKTVARAADHCANAQTLLSSNAKQQMDLIYDVDKQCLSIIGLQKYEPLPQQLIIREWLDYLGARMPNQKVMNAIQKDILQARTDANPLIQHDGYSIQRYRDGLYLVESKDTPNLQQIIAWIDKSQHLKLPDNGLLKIKAAQQGIAKAVWQQNSVEIRYRQGGEKMTLPNRSGSHSLKKLYQEVGIAPWQRETVPLIYINNELAAVTGYWVSTDFYVQDGDCITLSRH